MKAVKFFVSLLLIFSGIISIVLGILSVLISESVSTLVAENFGLTGLSNFEIKLYGLFGIFFGISITAMGAFTLDKLDVGDKREATRSQAPTQHQMQIIRENEEKRQLVIVSGQKNETVQIQEPYQKNLLICNNCGASNTKDALYCAECGHPLKNVSNVQKTPSTLPFPADSVPKTLKYDLPKMMDENHVIIGGIKYKLADWNERFFATLYDIVIVSGIVYIAGLFFELVLLLLILVLRFGLGANINFYSSFLVVSGNTVSMQMGWFFVPISLFPILIPTSLFLYWTYFTYKNQQSYGQRMMNIYLVTEEGGRPTFSQCMVNALGKMLFPIDIFLMWLALNTTWLDSELPRKPIPPETNRKGDIIWYNNLRQRFSQFYVRILTVKDEVSEIFPNTSEIISV